MFTVCPGCGAYTPEKSVDPSGPWALCPSCGYRHRFVQLPLFVITGPSGAGKTTACLALAGSASPCVALESDILWGAVPATPDDGYRSYWDTWLRVITTIHQSGRPVALFGTVMPEHLEHCTQRRYLGPIHYLALVCDDDVLVTRLRSRPAWRRAGTEAFLSEMLRYNRWLREHGATSEPPLILLDTGTCTLEESVREIRGWIERRL